MYCEHFYYSLVSPSVETRVGEECQDVPRHTQHHATHHKDILPHNNKCDTQHNNTEHSSVIISSVAFLDCCAECHDGLVAA